MRILTDGAGVVTIDQDERLLERIEGEELADVDISNLRTDAQILAELYNLAVRTPGDIALAKRYAALKQKCLEAWSRHVDTSSFIQQ